MTNFQFQIGFFFILKKKRFILRQKHFILRQLTQNKIVDLQRVTLFSQIF
jgi:hypothetical protein